MDGSPFDGLKVMDLAWVVAGPLIGRALAEYGATVVRVESSKRIDTARLMGPFPSGKPDYQRSVLYDNCNANKWGLALDLKRDEARKVALDMARWADVVIESFKPGQMDKFGLGYERLKALNPSLIMLSTSLMGQTGPYAQFSGFGNIGAALSGYQMIVGSPGQLPVGPFGPYTDFVGPRFALLTLIAALEHRRRTGEGCFIDASQAEAGISFLAPQIADFGMTGRGTPASGNRDPDFAPHGVFRTRGNDAWIAIVARDDAEWCTLAAIVGGRELAADVRFATLADRKENEDELERIVSVWTLKREAQALETELQAHGIPAHVVADSDAFMGDSQLLARGHFERVKRADGDVSVFETSRYRLSETPARFERSAPSYGRDNEFVLAELLGYDAKKIALLRESGVLE